MVSTIEKELNQTTSSFEEFQEDMENDGKGKHAKLGTIWIMNILK